MKFFTIVTVFTSMIEICHSACPANSMILQDQDLFWCVWIIEEKIPLSDMRMKCAMSDGFIFVVENDVVQVFLQETIGPVLRNLNITDDIWINYNSTTQTSLEDAPLVNTYWDINVPVSPLLDCVKARRPNYLWHGTECTDNNYGVCYKELDCKPNNPYYVSSYDLCYWLAAGLRKYTAYAGEDICQSDGGTLAVVPNAEIMDILINNTQIQTIVSWYNGGCWLGLNDIVSEGKFTTSTGEPAPYLRWHYGEPNNFYYIEDCVMLTTKYSSAIAMNDAYCNSEAVPICFKWNVSVPTTQNKLMTSSITFKSKTTTPSMTTSDVVSITTNRESNTSNQVLCLCQRETYNALYINNTGALDKQLEKLKTEVQVVFKNTSAYKKSLVCATDNRPSATNIGITATVVMLALLGMILFMDVLTMTGSLARPRMQKVS